MKIRTNNESFIANYNNNWAKFLSFIPDLIEIVVLIVLSIEPTTELLTDHFLCSVISNVFFLYSLSKIEFQVGSGNRGCVSYIFSRCVWWLFSCCCFFLVLSFWFNLVPIKRMISHVQKRFANTNLLYSNRSSMCNGQHEYDNSIKCLHFFS